jgi:hypothetical protein
MIRIHELDRWQTEVVVPQNALQYVTGPSENFPTARPFVKEYKLGLWNASAHSLMGRQRLRQAAVPVRVKRSHQQLRTVVENAQFADGRLDPIPNVRLPAKEYKLGQ